LLGTKHFLGREKTVQRCGKPRIDSHLHQYFRDLFTRETDIEARLDVDLQLRRRIAHGRQRCDRRDLAVAQAQSRPGLDVAERKLEHIGRKIRGNVGQGCDDMFACLAVNPGECPLAAFQPAFVGV
jgi:hypothetical protein